MTALRQLIALLAFLIAAHTSPLFGQCHECVVTSNLGCACANRGHGHCGLQGSREQMLGDWWGFRPALADHGIMADVRATRFYQGVASGGQNQEFRYGGKLDYNLTFLGGRLGLNQGFTALLHAETRFGDDVILDAAGLAPANANMLYPSLDNTTAITGLQFMQAVNEDWQLTFGKINTFDLLNTIYPQTGRGIDGFMNASTFLPLTVARTLPLSFLGAGILKLHEGQIQGSLLVYDNHNVPTTSGFDELFDNGASVAALWRLFTDVGGLPGSHLFLGTWANGTYDSLDPIDWAFVPGVGLVAPQDTGTWSATYILEQKLWVDCCCPNRHIGLLSQLGFADPETSPYEWVCNVGLQAQGLVAGRPRDTLGVGYFYSGLSDDLKSLVSPVIPLGDLQGGEFYYNATIRPWCHVTADLQVVNPADERNNTALVLGMRASIDL